MCDDVPVLVGTMPPKDYLVALVTVGLAGVAPNGVPAMRRYLESEGLNPDDNALRMLLLGAELTAAVVTAWAAEVGRPRQQLWQALMSRRAAWKAESRQRPSGGRGGFEG